MTNKKHFHEKRITSSKIIKFVLLTLQFENGETKRASFRRIKDAIQWLNLNDYEGKEERKI